MPVRHELQSVLMIENCFVEVGEISQMFKPRYQSEPKITITRRLVLVPIGSEAYGALLVGYCHLKVEEITLVLKPRFECTRKTVIT